MNRIEEKVKIGLKVRALIAGLVFVIVAQASGCGPKRVPVRAPEDRSVLAGVLDVDGSTPFTRTMRLTEHSGNIWVLEAPRFEGEINLMSGHTLRVEGFAAPGDDDNRVFVVTGYDIIPEQGLFASRGMIDEGEGGAIRISGDGESYGLSGPLTEILSEFKGFTAWVWGRYLPAASEGGQEIIEVTGYEVLMAGER